MTEPERNPDGTFKPGVSGNPNGRPPGSVSIKDKVRQYLEEHPEEMDKIVEHFIKNNRELMWQMLEGRPSQQTDVTSGGKPIPILGNVPINDGNTEDLPSEETH